MCTITSMKVLRAIVAVTGCAISLVACALNTSTSPPLHEGLYIGRSLDNLDYALERLTLIILENGETWIADDANSDGNPIYFSQGRFTAQETSSRTTRFLAVNAIAANNSQNILPAVVSFTSGITTENYSYARIEGRYADDQSRFLLVEGQPHYTGYNYNAPAHLANVVGVWNFYNPLRKIPNVSMRVDSFGIMSGANATTGCFYSGALTERPSKKNVFNVAITVFGCADSGAYEGIAYNYFGSNLIIDGSRPTVPIFKVMALSEDRARLVHLNMTRSIGVVESGFGTEIAL